MLANFLQESKPVFVLTGAGCSTASGIPAYRDETGKWQHAQPVNFNDFIKHETRRKHYWLRSMHGWRHVDNARPNATHFAIADLEQMGFISHVVTQNVDSLHQKAGSERVLDLHGNLQSVICLGCSNRIPRSDIQDWLEYKNAKFLQDMHTQKPDGDAAPAYDDLSGFKIPDCDDCGGLLKPDVVFFGESVPRRRVQTAMQELIGSRALLVVGSSLMVFSGYRFCRTAQQHGIPVAAINRGMTRADGTYTFKIRSDCGTALTAAVHSLAA